MSTSSFTTLFASLVISACFLIGCSSGGQDRRTDTVKTSAAVSVDVTKAKQDLDGVLSELKNLRDASDTADLKKMQGDLRKKATLFSDSVTSVVSSSDSAVTAGKTQNEAWHKEADVFTEADLRNASQKRQGDLRSAVDELAVASTALKTERDTYVSQLNQLVSALDLDLTQLGVQAIKPTLTKLVENEPKMRQALTDVAVKSRSMNTVINP